MKPSVALMKDSDVVDGVVSEAVPDTTEESIEQTDECQTVSMTDAETTVAAASNAVSSPHAAENEADGSAEAHVNEMDLNCSNSSTAEGLVDGVPVSDSKRKFRVLGLNFPGKWLEDEAFLDVLRKSESFHFWFERAPEGKVKPGGASVVFESVAEAKNAFASVQKMKIDGCVLRLEASKLFYEEGSNAMATQTPEKVIIPFDVEAAQNDTSYRLYAIHLHSSTKQDLLTSIFDAEYVETINLANDPYAPTEMQAEVIFRSEEEADTARAELNELEIEELDRMVLLSTDEYITYMKRVATESSSSQPRGTAPVPTSNSVSAATSHPSVPHIPAPELTVDDVAGFLQKHIEETRTNWAELNEVNELWKLCDDVSQANNGIPDSLLKLALLSVLEDHRNTLPSHWMRNHVDELIKVWKKEVQNVKTTEREGAVAMSAPTYSPPPTERRRGRHNKKSLTTLMGVGALLNTARTVLAVEEGEVEVDEDEHGIFSIDGQELTFESWGSLCKASSAKESQPQARIKPEYRKLRYQHKKGIREKKMEQEKLRRMQEAMEPQVQEEEEEEEVVKQDEVVEELPKEIAAGPSVSEPNETVKKRELEEGEMSSESSTSSSSSPSSSSEDQLPSGRNRRPKKRRHKKHGTGLQLPFAANPQFTQLLSQLYKQRHGLIKSLAPAQKHAFAAILNQIASSPQGMTSAQRNQMTVFMRNYASNTFPSK